MPRSWLPLLLGSPVAFWFQVGVVAVGGTAWHLLQVGPSRDLGRMGWIAVFAAAFVFVFLGAGLPLVWVAQRVHDLSPLLTVTWTLGLALVLAWVRPGETDGRAGRPTTAPGEWRPR